VIMTVLVTDPGFARQLRADRENSDAAMHDEVWDGVYVVSPIANNQHQWIIVRLLLAFQSVLDLEGGDRMYAGMNVSDRKEDWGQNYRVPDVAVVLSGNPAEDCETHLCGGPDFIVEVLSPGDLAREKLPFYAKIGVRELLLIDRDPWALELYRLEAGELRLGGTSHPDLSEPLASAVLPLVFRLVPGQDRPRVEVRTADGNQSWLA
jgi:Uma2 family endonuclease